MQDTIEGKASTIISQFRIPPKPEILTALQHELNKADPDPVDFARVVEQDVALSAVVLKTVNSPLFGLKRELSDIRMAVVMIGADKLNDLITYFTLRQSLSGKASISLEKFWDNTMEVATMSRFVHSFFQDKVVAKPEELYALGLFRDCGIPLMAMKYANYRDVLFEANHAPERVFTEVEEAYYPTNHATVGYYVASSWGLPKSLRELVLRHHETGLLHDATVSEEQKDLYALMKVASHAATQYKYGKMDSEWPLTEEAVLARLRLSDHDYEEILTDLVDEYHTVYGDL